MVQWRFFNILWCFLLSSLFNYSISSCSKESSCGNSKRSPFLEKERTPFVQSRGYMFHAYTMCTLSTATLKGDPLLIINSWGRQLLRNIEKPLAAVPNDTTKCCSLGSPNLLIYHMNWYIPRHPIFLHALSFECTTNLCMNFLNQFSFIFTFK